MELAAVLAAFLSLLNIGLAIRSIWKEWKARRTPPPSFDETGRLLESVLRDIAAAIRESKHS